MSRRSSRGSDVFRERDEDEQSIIDVFEFDDIAEDRWLCSTGTSSRRNSVEAKVQDIDGWLHADVQESDAAQSDSNSRRSIDTRTFTRIKRRSHNRLSFDSVEQSVSPETRSFSLSNVWKNQPIPESATRNVNNNNNKELKERRDSIPMMLRPKTNQVLAALLSESPSSISSQTSMEAFMNMASSKEGISSLISDMSDPDVSHFLMNISQPSLLYSSLISDGKGDESVHAAAAAFDSFIDSQILTDSMMEASMFKEAQDSTMIADFLKQNDCTVLEDETYCKSPSALDLNDKTFVNENIGDKTYINITDKDQKSSNSTFVTASENSKTNDTFTSFPSPISEFKGNSTKILSPLNSTKIMEASPNPLNSTRNLSFDHDIPVLLQKKDLVSTTITLDSENKTDLTFELKAKSTSPIKERLNETFQTSNFAAKPIPRLSGSSGNGDPLDSTFSAVPNLRAELLQEVRRSSNKFDATFNTPLPNTEKKFDTTYEHPNSAENKFDATYERPKPAEPVINDDEEEVEDLDATYVQMPLAHQPESQTVNKPVDVTYDSAHFNAKLSNAAGPRRISYAKQNPAESQMHSQDPNRFNTFRKDSKIGSRLSKASQPLENNSNKPVTAAPLQPHVPSAKSNENLYQQRFNTFSKKSSLLKNHVRNEMNEEENRQDSTFIKPLEKLPVRQIQAPRQLSKLPQMFQKSNPNLGSNLKPSGILTLEADVTFNKGSQPNISSNSHALSRFKSERLLPMKHNADFGSGNGTSRSMESIESTASAHSAPDLDDRLSICSDSSRASYTVKPRNLEALKKLASMEEQGRLGGSTPKVKGRQILENTWIEGKDLPSPILKNGAGRTYTESTDSRSTSPTDSAEFNAKTSSPLTISPAISDQAINTIGNDDGGIEAAKENIQVTENVRSKQIKVPNSVSTGTNATKLRRPSNWAGAPNKVGNGASSGIPRPASRIPGPKFTRSNLK
ncbi:uncharacterized protein LOC100677978 [Nasonia vitripennis]|uniref:Uncharacterized protein n=1 Tax=Nasonia vitripennis TaxID=7425 RepID=A0A7M7GDW4_NASVI|nr:uncharacterized protein LOC100677978 [Nasonia vitripennis]